MVDVLTAAWIGAGCPRATDDAAEGSCARCGTRGRPLSATSAVVSKNFTAVDNWVDPRGAGLCSACTWAHRTKGLRQHPHLVARTPAKLSCLTGLELGQILTRRLSPRLSLVVPLRRGRQHLLPLASWGRVTVDDISLPWTIADVGRLATLTDLRRRGFTPAALAEAAPPYRLLKHQPRADWDWLLTVWSELDPWRLRRPWLRLALAATADTARAAA